MIHKISTWQSNIQMTYSFEVGEVREVGKWLNLGIAEWENLYVFEFLKVGLIFGIKLSVKLLVVEHKWRELY